MNDASRDPDSPIELCAKVAAAIEQGASVDSAAQRVGLSPAALREAKRHCLSALEAEVATRGGDRTRRYLATYFGALAGAERRGSTDELDVSRLERARDGGIPFVAPVAPSVQVTPARPTFDDLDPSGDTLAEGDEVPVPTLPFTRRAEDMLMSLDRYADLAAHLRAHPASATAVLAQFGLDTVEQRDRVHHLWRLRFDANAELYETFLQAVEQKFTALVSTLPTDPST